eukprot:1095468-Rhodomonas_salina.3
MSGTGIADGAISLRACYAMSGTEIAYQAIRTKIEKGAEGGDGAERMVLPGGGRRQADGGGGGERGRGGGGGDGGGGGGAQEGEEEEGGERGGPAQASSCSGMLLRQSYAISGTDVAYVLCRVQYGHIMCCYQPRQRGTELACGASCLRAPYAVSGTEIAYAATRRRYGGSTTRG